MNTVSSHTSGVEIQLGLFDAILDLLLIEPIFLLGLILIAGSLVVLFKRDHTIPKIKISILSLLLYYYLCILFTKIVGIPTLSEYMRLSGLGEGFFHPNINLIPFSDGISLSFLLNIFLFIPLGFLCPIISRTFWQVKNIFLIGFFLSLFIEISQLFTLYRATDINDLLTNIMGTLFGYLCFKLTARLRIIKLYPEDHSWKKDDFMYLPILIIIVSFLLGFFS